MPEILAALPILLPLFIVVVLAASPQLRQKFGWNTSKKNDLYVVDRADHK